MLWTMMGTLTWIIIVVYILNNVSIWDLVTMHGLGDLAYLHPLQWILIIPLMLEVPLLILDAYMYTFWTREKRESTWSKILFRPASLVVAILPITFTGILAGEIWMSQPGRFWIIITEISMLILVFAAMCEERHRDRV
jgi:hypothetical protein